MIRPMPKLQFLLLSCLAACAGGSLQSYVPHALLPLTVAHPRALPPNLLYVAGGPTTEPHPFIEVFNARDTSKSPTPIYTIAPIGGGSYGLFAVDGTNDLFAINYFSNGAQLLVFPSGKTKPKVSCRLSSVPQGMSIAGGVLYLSTAGYTVEEYTLPIAAGSTCPNPTQTLTDQRAKLRGQSGLWQPAVDSKGDVFDLWVDGTLGEKIDEFSAGSKTAHQYAPLPKTFADFYMTADPGGNLITSISGSGTQYESIAVFPHGKHFPKRFHPIANGAYLGFAVAGRGTELYAAVDYPTTRVEVFAYNSQTGQVGSLLRSFTDVWYYNQSVAVFSRK
jgi:hypothetical protein